MFEPRYLPQMQAITLSLDGVSFGIKHASRFIGPEDDLAESPHIHPYIEVFFNEDADVSFLVDGVLRPVRPTEAIVIRSSEVHVCVYHSYCDHRYFCFWIDAPKDSALVGFLDKMGRDPIASFDECEWKNMCELLEELQNSEEPVGRYAALFSVISLLGKAVMRKTPSRPTLSEQMTRIVSYIDANFTEIGGVSELAQRFFVSTATIGRLFKRYLHISPYEYIQSRKMSEAVRLLADGAGVTEACLGAGFSDTSHFIALFKKRFGKTPLEYKKQIGKPSFRQL